MSHDSLQVKLSEGKTSTPLNKHIRESGSVTISPSKCVDALASLVETRDQFKTDMKYKRYIETPKDEVVDYITTLILNDDEALKRFFPGFVDFFRSNLLPKSDFIMKYELIFHMVMAMEFYPNNSQAQDKLMMRKNIPTISNTEISERATQSQPTKVLSPIKLTIKAKNSLNEQTGDNQTDFIVVKNKNSSKEKKERATKKVARKLENNIETTNRYQALQSIEKTEDLDISGVDELSDTRELLKQVISVPQKIIQAHALLDKAKTLQIESSMAEIDETIHHAMEAAKEVKKTLGSKQDLNVTDLVEDINTLGNSSGCQSFNTVSSDSPIPVNCIDNPEKLLQYSSQIIELNTSINPPKRVGKRDRKDTKEDDSDSSPSPAHKKKSQFKSPDAATKAAGKMNWGRGKGEGSGIGEGPKSGKRKASSSPMSEKPQKRPAEVNKDTTLFTVEKSGVDNNPDKVTCNKGEGANKQKDSGLDRVKENKNTSGGAERERVNVKKHSDTERLPAYLIPKGWHPKQFIDMVNYYNPDLRKAGIYIKKTVKIGYILVPITPLAADLLKQEVKIENKRMSLQRLGAHKDEFTTVRYKNIPREAAMHNNLHTRPDVVKIQIRENLRNQDKNQTVELMITFKCKQEVPETIRVAGSIYHVSSDTVTKRCTRCQSLDHWANKCKGKVTCCFCAGEHKSHTCFQKIRKGERVTLKCANCGQGHRASDEGCIKLKEKRQAQANNGGVVPLMSVQVDSDKDFPSLSNETEKIKTPPPVWVKPSKTYREYVPMDHSSSNQEPGIIRILLTALVETQLIYPKAEKEITALVEKLGISNKYQLLLVEKNHKNQSN